VLLLLFCGTLKAFVMHWFSMLAEPAADAGCFFYDVYYCWVKIGIEEQTLENEMTE